MDDNADRLARKKMKTDAMKRAFAINGECEVTLHASRMETDSPQITHVRRKPSMLVLYATRTIDPHSPRSSRSARVPI